MEYFSVGGAKLKVVCKYFSICVLSALFYDTTNVTETVSQGGGGRGGSIHSQKCARKLQQVC